MYRVCVRLCIRRYCVVWKTQTSTTARCLVAAVNFFAAGGNGGSICSSRICVLCCIYTATKLFLELDNLHFGQRSQQLYTRPWVTHGTESDSMWAILEQRTLEYNITVAHRAQNNISNTHSLECIQFQMCNSSVIFVDFCSIWRVFLMLCLFCKN